MTVDTNKMVEILENDQPLSVIMIEEHGKEKLVVMFALPNLAKRIEEFAKHLLNDQP